MGRHRRARSRKSDNRVKGYDNLYRKESGALEFRKWSSEKSAQFRHSTGISDNPARAYREGLEAYNNWLGRDADESGVVYFGRFARKCMNEKFADPTLSDQTKRTWRNQLEGRPETRRRLKPEPRRRRLLEAFGHLRVDQVVKKPWLAWVVETLQLLPGFRFFNARKVMLEILGIAVKKKYIEELPELPIPDGEAAPPIYIAKDLVLKILRECYPRSRPRAGGKPHPVGFYRRRSYVKLLAFIMWKQGGRPGEILQYRWDMIRWDEGPTGSIHIPGKITKNRKPRAIMLNSKVARILRWLEPRASSPFIFPGQGQKEGHMVEYRNAWETAVKNAGRPELTIYNLRDTCITNMLIARESSIFIGKFVQSSPTMIDKRYAVLVEAIMRRLAG